MLVPKKHGESVLRYTVITSLASLPAKTLAEWLIQKFKG